MTPIEQAIEALDSATDALAGDRKASWKPSVRTVGYSAEVRSKHLHDGGNDYGMGWMRLTYAHDVQGDALGLDKLSLSNHSGSIHLDGHGGGDQFFVMHGHEHSIGLVEQYSTGTFSCKHLQFYSTESPPL